MDLQGGGRKGVDLTAEKRYGATRWVGCGATHCCKSRPIFLDIPPSVDDL